MKTPWKWRVPQTGNRKRATEGGRTGGPQRGKDGECSQQEKDTVGPKASRAVSFHNNTIMTLVKTQQQENDVCQKGDNQDNI